MPIFEYNCTKCGHKFEELVFGDEKPVCPACQASETEKVISMPCRVSATLGYSSNAIAAAAAAGASAGMRATSGCGSCSGGSCSTCH